MKYPRKSYKRFNYLLLGLVIFAALFGSLTRSRHAGAASYTWDGGCGATTTWSCANNWSSDIVPAAGDTITFDNTSDNNSTVDALFNATETIVTINISSGYDGTITLGTTLHVSTSWVQAAGTFTATNQTLDINGTFLLTAGTFTASSGVTSVASTFTVSGSPTFNHNSGTFTFDASGSAALSCNNISFNLVTFNQSVAVLETINSDCSLPLGTNPSIPGRITLNGTLSGTGTLTLASSSSSTLNTGATLTGFSGLASTGPLTIAGATINFGSYTSFVVSNTLTLSSGTLTLPNGADLNGALTISGGTFNAPSGTMTIGRALTISGSPTFNANGGTVTFDGVTNDTLSCNSVTFNLVTIAHTGGIKTISSDCSLPLGANPTIGSGATADITLNGTLSGTGTLTIASAASGNVLTLNSTAALTGFSGLAAGGITTSSFTKDFSSYTTFSASGAYAQTGGTITVPNGADFNGAFTLSSSGVFNAPSGTATFASNFTLNSGTTFNANGGTVTFDGSTATLSCNNTIFNLVIINGGASTKTVSSDCNLPLGNNPSVSRISLSGTLSGTGTITFSTTAAQLNATAALSGFDGLVSSVALSLIGTNLNVGNYTTFDINSSFTLSSGAVFTAPSGTATFASTFTLNSGTTFNANGGTVTIDGSTGSVITCNGATFNLVTISHSGGTKSVTSTCSLPLGNNPTMTAAVSLTGTLSGSGKLTENGSLVLSTGAVLSGFNGLSTGGTLTISGATVDLGSYSPVTANGNFTLSSGTFTAPTGTMTVTSNFTISGGTFNANGGTVTFDGLSSATLACNSTSFNLVTFAQTAGTKTVGSDCSFPLGANPTAGAGGSITLYGTLSGSGTLTTTGTLALSSTASLSGFGGLSTDDIITSANIDFSGYSVFEVADDYLQTAGTISLPSGTNIGGDFTLMKPAILTAPSGTFFVAGNLYAGSNPGHMHLLGTSGNYASTPDSAPLSITGDIDVRVNVALDSWRSSQNQTLVAKYDSVLTSDRSYQLLYLTGGFLLFNGSSSGSATNYTATSTVAVDDIGSSSIWLRSTRNSTTGDVTFYTSTDGSIWNQLGSVVTVAAGAMFDSPSPMRIGAQDPNSTTPALASGKFYHAQIRNNVLDDGTGIVFDADFTNHADGTTSFTESSTNAATVTLNGSTAAIYSAGAGTFNHNNGTVVLDGGNQTLDGNLTFNNLTKNVTTASTLTVVAGSTIKVDGTLSLKGTADQLLTLASSTFGSHWMLDRSNNYRLTYVAVSDAYSVDRYILACASVDNGNNYHFLFDTASCYDPIVTEVPVEDTKDVAEEDDDTPVLETVDTTDALTKSSKARTYLAIAALVFVGLGFGALFLRKRSKQEDYDL